MSAEIDGMSESSRPLRVRLNELLVESHLSPLEPETGERFADYCALLLRWNSRMNLTAVRDEDAVLSRHFVESIACAQALPVGITTLLDLGSGAGFPGIPIALCRPEIAVTLAESQWKKAAFLQEAIRTLGLSTRVHTGRAETLATLFDCVALRAVDRMQEAIHLGVDLINNAGWFAVLTSVGELDRLKAAAGAGILWIGQQPLPGSESRILLLGQRRIDEPTT